MVAKKSSQAIRMNLIQMHRKVVKQRNQVSRGYPDTGKVTPPVDDVTKYGPVDGDPITSTEEIPFDKKREFNPDLKPGEERVKQKGEPGTKTITTPKQDSNREKVGEGEPTEKITKQPVDEITVWWRRNPSQAIRMNLIQMHRKVAKRTFQVNQELKHLIRGEVVTPPVDDVTKWSVDGIDHVNGRNSIRQRNSI